MKPERAILEANMGGDKKASHRYFERGGHGKTVIAEVTLTDEAVRRVLRTTIDDLLELSWAGTHGAVASGMQSVAFTPATAIAAVFTATGQDLGMVGTSSMAHGTGKRVEGGLNAAIRLPGLEVGTVGGGTTLPYARAWLGLMDCAGPGKVYRFAQIVAAATLALEISASSAMATSGSENFFKAHFERGGLRYETIPPHHDPACFGCGDNPIGFHLPQPGDGGRGPRTRRPSRFDERHQGGPGLAHGGMVAALIDEACGLAGDLVPLPGRDGADLPALPAARCRSTRQLSCAPSVEERARAAHLRARRALGRRRAARRGAAGFRPRPARALPRHARGPGRRRGLAAEAGRSNLV